MQRYREGEETIAQDHQDVTVIFADIVGLDEMSADLTSDESLAIVNKLVRQFDAAADNLGVERVRTLAQRLSGQLRADRAAPRQRAAHRRLRNRDAAHHRQVQPRERPRAETARGHRHRHRQ